MLRYRRYMVLPVAAITPFPICHTLGLQLNTVLSCNSSTCPLTHPPNPPTACLSDVHHSIVPTDTTS